MADPDDDLERMMILGGTAVIIAILIVAFVGVGSIIGIMIGQP